MQVNQVQDYGAVNMAITVPKYSDAGGTNTNLPTRRLTGFSGAGIAQMGAPGRALSNVGRNIQAAAKGVVDENIKEAKEESRLWVVNAETELQEALVARDNDLKANTVPNDYLHNDSFKDGTNPETFYNRSKSAFETEINSKIDPDDSTSKSRYEPPSDFARDLWEKSKARIRSSYSINAMQYEGQVRSQALLDQLETNLQKQNTAVYDDPTLIDNNLATIDNLVGAKDDPATEKNEGNGIKGEHLVGVRTEQANKMVVSGYQGLIATDAFAALAALNGKKIKDSPGNLALIKHNSKLTVGQKDALISEAKRKASVILEVDILKFDQVANTHINSLAAGGAGLPEFNVRDMRDGLELSVLEQSHKDLFFGKYGELKQELLPELADKEKASWQKLSSQVRVARVTGMYINSVGTIPAKDLTSTLEDMKDVGKNPTGDYNDVLAKFTNTNNPDMKDQFSKLSFLEKQQVVQNTIAAMAAEIDLRTKDFGAWTETYDAIQNMKDSTPEEKYAKLEAKYALSEKLGQPAGSNFILSKGTAQGISGSANAIKSVDAAVTFYDGLVETYGQGDANNPVFQRVWQQLTGMKSGALGPEWQWFAAVKNNQAGGMFFNAAKSDESELLGALSSKGPMFTKSELDKSIAGTFNDFISATTGNNIANAGMGNWMMESIQKMVMQETIQNNHNNYSTAVGVVLNGLTDGLGVINDQRILGLILPQHNVNADIIRANASEFFDASPTIMESQITDRIGEQVLNGDLFIPGSLQLTGEYAEGTKREFFMGFIKKHGQFTMGTNGNSLVLMIPQNATSADSHDGYGGQVPLFTMNADGSRGDPVKFPLKYIEGFSLEKIEINALENGPPPYPGLNFLGGDHKQRKWIKDYGAVYNIDGTKK